MTDLDFIKQDLETFSVQDLEILAKYYNVSNLDELAKHIYNSYQNLSLKSESNINHIFKKNANMSTDMKSKLKNYINSNDIKKFKELLEFIPLNEGYDESVIKLLLQKDSVDFFTSYIEKFNINVNSLIDGIPLLMYALENDSDDIIIYLLNRPDIDLNIFYEKGTLFEHILERIFEEVIDLSLTQIIAGKIKDPNMKQTTDDKTYLMLFLEFMNKKNALQFTNIINNLLSLGAKINDQTTANPGGSTALMFACQNNNVSSEIVSLLINKGAKVNIQNNNKKTALTYCLEYDSKFKGPTSEAVKKINILIAAGADVKLSDNEGDSFIHYLAKNKINKYSIEILELILSRDKRLVNDQNNELLTPLMFAVNNEDFDKFSTLIQFITILLENGADPNKKDKDGQSILFYINDNVKHFTQILELLLDYGLDINSVDNYGNNILFVEFDLPIYKILIRHGANFNHINKNGKGVLATNFNYIPKRDYLISIGAPHTGLDQEQLKIYYKIKIKTLETELDKYTTQLTPQEKDVINKECLGSFKKFDKEHYEKISRCVIIAKNMVKLRPEGKKIKELERKYEYHPYFQDKK